MMRDSARIARTDHRNVWTWIALVSVITYVGLVSGCGAAPTKTPSKPTGPVVNVVRPNNGPVSGGTVVTFYGAFFQSGVTVSFGGTASSTITVISSAQMAAVTPAHVFGSVDIVITNPDGGATTIAGGFTYNAVPSVSAVSPSAGSIVGGTPVTITGTGFQAGASVRIGGLDASNITVVSAMQITAISPAHAAGAVDVTVTNPDGGTATKSSGYTYEVPVVLSPTSLTFPRQTVGTSSSAQAVTLTNTGTTTLTISSIVASGDFAQTNNCGTSVLAGASCSISTTFTPTTTGNRAGAVTITDNAINSPQIVPLSGTGVAVIGILTIAQAPTLAFGNVMLGNSSTLPVTVSNTGTAGSSVTISQQPMISPSAFTLAPLSLPLTMTVGGQPAMLLVTFAPTAETGVTGSLTITSDASNSPTSISLTGSAHHVDLSWTASTSSNVVSYNIYRSTVSGDPNPTKIGSVLSPITSFKDWNVQAAGSYFYKATAVDSSGIESVFSNEAPSGPVPSP
jgi:hypothetical protein